MPRRRRPPADERGEMAGSKDGIGVVGWRKRVLDSYCALRASVALALAPEKPRAAATAILRIEALADEFFAKPISVRRIGETENTVPDIVPSHRVPAQTERKPTAEFVHDVVVPAHDLIGAHCDLVRPFTVDPVCG